MKPHCLAILQIFYTKQNNYSIVTMIIKIRWMIFIWYFQGLMKWHLFYYKRLLASVAFEADGVIFFFWKNVPTSVQFTTHPHARACVSVHTFGGGQGFMKINLSDTYNQIKLGPKETKETCIKYTQRSSSTEEINLWTKVRTWIFSADHGPAYARPTWSSSLPGWSTD